MPDATNRRFCQASELNVPPDKFWLEQIQDFIPDITKSQWPHTQISESKGIFTRRIKVTRTITKTKNGCNIEDNVEILPRFQFLGPWLKAAHILRFKKRHEHWRALYT